MRVDVDDSDVCSRLTMPKALQLTRPFSLLSLLGGFQGSFSPYHTGEDRESSERLPDLPQALELGSHGFNSSSAASYLCDRVQVAAFSELWVPLLRRLR